MNVIIIDNYDSFTYNLYQYLKEISDCEIDVVRNDKISVEEVGKYDIIILSPGPGVPADAGNMPAILKRYKSEKPILGVCLGHQAIGELYGSEIENLDQVYHGVDCGLNIVEECGLFKGVESGNKVGRYHSWIIKKGTTPEELIVTAEDNNGEIMAVRHKTDPVYGVQFHPESILTPQGKMVLINFLEIAKDFIKNR
ncbi:anthranilate synthase component II [Membranihabitans maritimus]|uniref:anthranilate synthase component II n=1 Tax=Membranihabitans maritimus TaxID=2904244 RepID=UPI001F1CDD87|nr:aminodeoxychorismate/anthranilate synthase component II [Membranihabitans maritimus]